MKKVINFCGNCPFKYSNYEEFNLNDPIVDVCTLQLFFKQEDYIISTHKYFDDENLETPEWCKLKEEDFEFTFKEFSSERLQEIEDTKKEFEELENLFSGYDIEDFEIEDNPEYKENNDKLAGLYSKLTELYKNEEEPYFETDVEEDISNQVEEIQKQLSLLENHLKS